MSANLPVLERIALAIVARLQTVTVTDGASYNIGKIVRPTRLSGTGSFSPQHLMAQLFQGDIEFDEENSTDGNPRLKAWRVPFGVILYVRLSDFDQTAVDQVINIFRSDVETALTAPENWQQFADAAGEDEDHLATNSWLDAPDKMPDTNAEYEGVVVNYTVEFRTPENDPTTVG